MNRLYFFLFRFHRCRFGFNYRPRSYNLWFFFLNGWFFNFFPGMKIIQVNFPNDPGLFYFVPPGREFFITFFVPDGFRFAVLNGLNLFGGMSFDDHFIIFLILFNLFVT